MRCFCCNEDLQVARKVKIRRWCDFSPERGGPESAAYMAYEEEMTFRWGVVCENCYVALDNESGVAQVGAHRFNLAGVSRGNRATIIDEKQYRQFQRREATKLGLDLPEAEE